MTDLTAAQKRNGWIYALQSVIAQIEDGTLVPGDVDAADVVVAAIAGITGDSAQEVFAELAARKAAYQAPAAAADTAALKAQFDALLAKLVTAKLMAAS